MSTSVTLSNTMVDGRIPVLDVGPFLSREQGSAEDLAKQVKRTCEDTGFLVIGNHGVQQDLIDRAFAEASNFFALDEARKLELKVAEQNIGYLPYGGQTMKTSTVHKTTLPNYSKSFYITTPDPDAEKYGTDADLNKWPLEMPEFKAAQTAYFTTMRALAHRFLPVFALALDLPEDYFEEDFAGPSSTVRLIEYAPQEITDDELFGFAPHTDGSFITFLPRSKFPGLEVRTKEGSWIKPPSVDGTFVVNTGEMLSRYSNDRFIPTPHRVINRSGSTRHAMPFFYGPNRQRVIHCVPTCVSDENPPRYEPMNSYQLNEIKDKTNFPHRQAAAE